MNMFPFLADPPTVGPPIQSIFLLLGPLYRYRPDPCLIFA